MSNVSTRTAQLTTELYSNYSKIFKYNLNNLNNYGTPPPPPPAPISNNAPPPPPPPMMSKLPEKVVSSASHNTSKPTSINDELKGLYYQINLKC